MCAWSEEFYWALLERWSCSVYSVFIEALQNAHWFLCVKCINSTERFLRSDLHAFSWQRIPTWSCLLNPCSFHGCRMFSCHLECFAARRKHRARYPFQTLTQTCRSSICDSKWMPLKHVWKGGRKNNTFLCFWFRVLILHLLNLFDRRWVGAGAAACTSVCTVKNISHPWPDI